MTEQQDNGATDTAVTAGYDDLPALKLASGFVRFAVRGDVVNRRRVEFELLSRESILVLERWDEALPEFFRNLLRLVRRHGSLEDWRGCRWGSRADMGLLEVL
jgi:hypothetical protein